LQPASWQETHILRQEKECESFHILRILRLVEQQLQQFFLPSWLQQKQVWSKSQSKEQQQESRMKEFSKHLPWFQP
jgi:hypothetical protein